MRSIVLAALAGVVASNSFAFDNGQWKDIPDNVRRWFNIPKIKACCNTADGSRTDWEMKPDGYYVPVPWQKEWTRVPDEAVVIDPQNPNPTGDAVIWLNLGGKAIRCFAPGGGV